MLPQRAMSFPERNHLDNRVVSLLCAYVNLIVTTQHTRIFTHFFLHC
jgi:hypothetical protein